MDKLMLTLLCINNFWNQFQCSVRQHDALLTTDKEKMFLSCCHTCFSHAEAVTHQSGRGALSHEKIRAVNECKDISLNHLF